MPKTSSNLVLTSLAPHRIDDMPDKMFQCPIGSFVKILAPDGHPHARCHLQPLLPSSLFTSTSPHRVAHGHGHGHAHFAVAARIKCFKLMLFQSIKFVQTWKRLYRANTGNRLITFSCSIFYSKFYKWKDILSRHEGSLIGLISFCVVHNLLHIHYMRNIVIKK